jgi:hypothetical protein
MLGDASVMLRLLRMATRALGTGSAARATGARKIPAARAEPTTARRVEVTALDTTQE